MQSAQDTSSAESFLYIPDTLRDWPWKPDISPYYEEVKAEHTIWFSKFMPAIREIGLSDHPEKFDAVGFTAWGSPKISRDMLRVSAKFIAFGFTFDGCTDCQPASLVRKIVNLVKHVLHNPEEERPEGEIFLGQLAKEFWQAALEVATPPLRQRFLDVLISFFHHTLSQAEDRDDGILLTRDKYMDHRRENGAPWPTFLSAALELNIPQYVFDHPIVREMEICAADAAIYDNDLLSYAKEYAMGDDETNILTIMMRHENTKRQEAVYQVCELHSKACKRFSYLMDHLPSFTEEIDRDLRQYLFDIVGAWVRGNYEYSFDSGRYFGKKGREIYVTRLVPIPSRGNADSYRAMISI